MKAHISFDDVFLSLRWAYLNRPQSIFGMSFFGTLSIWHAKYGAEFSLYCFERGEDFSIQMLPDKYKDELRQNSWLKFGFHAHSNRAADMLQDNNEFELSFNRCKHFFSEFQENDINTLRLHSWSADSKQVQFLASKGIKRLLCCDSYRRVSYDLTEPEICILNQNGRFIKNGMEYLKTNIRFDNCFDIEGALRPFITSGAGLIVMFGHEKYFTESSSQIGKAIEAIYNCGGTFVSE